VLLAWLYLDPDRGAFPTVTEFQQLRTWTENSAQLEELLADEDHSEKLDDGLLLDREDPTADLDDDWFNVVQLALETFRKLAAGNTMLVPRALANGDPSNEGVRQTERTAPMSKAELARRILNNSTARSRDIDWQGFDLQPAGGAKWTIRIDVAAVDITMRKRLEKPVK
jgi:hypothetical protein